jgi:proteic killer suppression protein
VFASEKLRKILSNEKEIYRKYGAERGRIMIRRLVQLRAAMTLEVMRTLPQAKCHELGQDRQGQLAVDADYPYRLIFEPAQDPLPVKSDGGLDWKGVTTIRIIEVVDYHGK